MTKHILKADIEPLSESQQGIRQKTEKNKRICLLPYRDVINVLKENYSKKLNDPERYAVMEVMGYKIKINGLKLRTFASHDNGEYCECNNKQCSLRPAYFALQQSSTRNKARADYAHLGLYGLDENGYEIEFTHDHTLARCFGGANALVNTTVMCYPCNNGKSRIESKVHNRTLRILKKYLEETTGEKVEPQYLLQRVRKNKLNLTDSEVTFERAGIISLSEGLGYIRDPEKIKETLLDKQVKVSGSRLEAFAGNDNPCCEDENCSIPATHFAVERIEKDFTGDKGFFLNMYGTHNGKEVLFVHSHEIIRDKNGIEDIKIITLCNDCSNKRFEIERDKTLKSLTQNIGVSRHENNKEKKKQKIIKIAQEIALEFNVDMEGFRKLCEERGKTEGFPNKMPNKSSGIRLVMSTLNVSCAGARWFRAQETRIQEIKKQSLKDIVEDKRKDLSKSFGIQEIIMRMR